MRILFGFSDPQLLFTRIADYSPENVIQRLRLKRDWALVGFLVDRHRDVMHLRVDLTSEGVKVVEQEMLLTIVLPDLREN